MKFDESSYRDLGDLLNLKLNWYLRLYFLLYPYLLMVEFWFTVFISLLHSVL
jgi:hypothetical protein